MTRKVEVCISTKGRSAVCQPRVKSSEVKSDSHQHQFFHDSGTWLRIAYEITETGFAKEKGTIAYGRPLALADAMLRLRELSWRMMYVHMGARSIRETKSESIADWLSRESPAVGTVKLHDDMTCRTIPSRRRLGFQIM